MWFIFCPYNRKRAFFIPVYGRNEREIAAGAFYGGTVYTLIAGLF
jgi:hypothetical protein